LRLTSIGRRLLSVSLDLHATGDSGVGLTARQVSHVDEGIVECGEDVANTESVLGLLSSTNGGRSVVSNLLFLSAFFALSAFSGLLLLCL
jgi:hypothetical protein